MRFVVAYFLFGKERWFCKGLTFRRYTYIIYAYTCFVYIDICLRTVSSLDYSLKDVSLYGIQTEFTRWFYCILLKQYRCIYIYIDQFGVLLKKCHVMGCNWLVDDLIGRCQVCQPKNFWATRAIESPWWSWFFLEAFTLPETNSLHLKIDPWKRRFLLEITICRGYVSFRECIFVSSITVVSMIVLLCCCY